MALRRPVGLAVLAVLVGLAMVTLAPPGPRRTAEPAGAATWLSLTIVAALTVPALVLVVIAAVRFRPRRAATPPREAAPPGHPWLGALILLAFLAIAIGTMVLLRPARREPGTATDPPPASATEPTPEPAAPDDQPWFLLVLAVIAVLLTAAAFARRRRPVQPEPERAPQSPLATAVAKALRAVVAPAADPRTAIIRCYAAMEEALGSIPGAAPRPADSPSEVLRRATEAGAVRSGEAWRLVELFDEARFSRHPMTEPDRVAAEGSLRLILAELSGRPA